MTTIASNFAHKQTYHVKELLPEASAQWTLQATDHPLKLVSMETGLSCDDREKKVGLPIPLGFKWSICDPINKYVIGC